MVPRALRRIHLLPGVHCHPSLHHLCPRCAGFSIPLNQSFRNLRVSTYLLCLDKGDCGSSFRMAPVAYVGLLRL